MITITLKKDFNEEQAKIAEKLKSELTEACHELEEYSNYEVYGLKDNNGEMSILLEIDYSDPEQDGNLTLFGCY